LAADAESGDLFDIDYFRLLAWSRVAVDVVAAVRFEVHLAEESQSSGLREAIIAGTSRRIYLSPETVVTNSDIAQATSVRATTAAMTICRRGSS
jgi:hypothetical protein